MTDTPKSCACDHALKNFEKRQSQARFPRRPRQITASETRTNPGPKAAVWQTKPEQTGGPQALRAQSHLL